MDVSPTRSLVAIVMNKPKYRNGREINIGEIAIGCWGCGRNKRVATVIITDVTALDEKSGMFKAVSFCYLNGKPDGTPEHPSCTGYELYLIEDIFTGDVEK
jgi:hypothetical protein